MQHTRFLLEPGYMSTVGKLHIHSLQNLPFLYLDTMGQNIFVFEAESLKSAFCDGNNLLAGSQSWNGEALLLILFCLIICLWCLE